ncbi:MAG TPA: sigma-70 family RNA polymerase sigma factor [Nannocystaceae bacterium]|nr:sigma-70 family RNA polymerase sigma factor [Nannocystaceae bacterium]
MRSDADLLVAWQGGNAAAGEQLLARYRGKLLRFFDLRVSLDAEDLTQRTLLACVEGHAGIRSLESFRSYVFGIARNILLQHVRQQSRDARATDFSDVGSSDPGPSPSRVVAAHEEQRLLLRVLQELPLEAQLVLELYYWEGMPPQEIADAFGMPKSTITTRLYRARQELREAIANVNAPVRTRESLAADVERWTASLRELKARMPDDA